MRFIFSYACFLGGLFCVASAGPMQSFLGGIRAQCPPKPPTVSTLDAAAVRDDPCVQTPSCVIPGFFAFYVKFNDFGTNYVRE